VSIDLLAALSAGRAPSMWRRDIARSQARVRILVDTGRWMQDLSSTMPVLREGPLFGPLLEVVAMEDTPPAAVPLSHPTGRSGAARAPEPRRRSRTWRQGTEPATQLVTRPDAVSRPRATAQRHTKPVPSARRLSESAPSGPRATTLPRQAPAALLSTLTARPAGPLTSHPPNRTSSPILVPRRAAVKLPTSVDPAGAIAYREDLIRRASAVIDAGQPPSEPADGSHLATQWASPLSGERAPAALLLSTEEVGRFSAPVDGAPRSAPDRTTLVGPSEPGHRPGTAAGLLQRSPETASGGAADADRFRELKSLAPTPVLAAPAERMEPDEVPYVAPDGEDLALPDAFGGWIAPSPSLPAPLPAARAHATPNTMHLADLERVAARQTLAEEMSRILVEEARRHGIDV
jgi:hypothetical protein